MAAPVPYSPQAQFRFETGNEQFQRRSLTWVTLFFLLIVYPGSSLIGMGGEDPLAMLKDMNAGMLSFLLLVTVMFQWTIFLLNYVAVYKEGTGLIGLGLKRIRGVDFLWTVSFMLAAWLILTGASLVLGWVGLPPSGDVGLLIPKDPFGRGLWVIVSFTAGFCEEVAFRGYLMTRLRLVGKFNSWVIPTAISALAFGICHAYQGIPGFILITLYGVLFSLLYIRTGTLWPGIIAHALWDLGALFYPY